LRPLASQSPSPAKQRSTSQLPAAQLTSPDVELHATPHPPQSVPLAIDTSHPVAAIVSQSAKSSSQTPSPHDPAVHLPSAWSARHWVPQPPQCWVSVAVSTQLDPHCTAAGAAHAATQVLAPDASTPQSGVVSAHAVAHAPQSLGLISEASQPVEAIVSQSS
jgi:hypothetical protein